MTEDELLEEVKRQLGIAHNRFDAFILMHLRNKKHDLKETVAKMRRRRAMEKAVFGNLDMTPEMRSDMASGTIQIIGRDNEGREVFYINTRREFPKRKQRDMKRTNFDMFFSYSTRMRHDFTGHDCIWIVNQKDASAWSNTDIPFQAEMAIRISKFWPGALHRMYVVNMSAVLGAVVRGLVTRLPESLRTIIHILTDDDLKNGRFLLETMSKDVVPVELGGLNHCDDYEHWWSFCADVEEYAMQMKQGVQQGKWIKEKEYELFVDPSVRDFDSDSDLDKDEEEEELAAHREPYDIDVGFELKARTPFYSPEISSVHAQYQRKSTLALLDRYGHDAARIAHFCGLMTKELAAKYPHAARPGNVDNNNVDKVEEELKTAVSVFPSYYLALLQQLLRFSLRLCECSSAVLHDLRYHSGTLHNVEAITEMAPNFTDPLLRYLLQQQAKASLPASSHSLGRYSLFHDADECEASRKSKHKNQNQNHKRKAEKETSKDSATTSATTTTSLYDYLGEASKEAEALEGLIAQQQQLVELHFEVLGFWDRVFGDTKGQVPATRAAVEHLLSLEADAAEKRYKVQLNRTRYHEGCFFLFRKLSDESSEASINFEVVEPLLAGAVRALLNHATTNPNGEPRSPLSPRRKHQCLFCDVPSAAERRERWMELEAFGAWNAHCDVASRARMIAEGQVQASLLHKCSIHDVPRCVEVMRNTVLDVDLALEEHRQQGGDDEELMESLIPLTRLVKDSLESFAHEAAKLHQAETDLLAVEKRLFVLRKYFPPATTTYDNFLLDTDALVQQLALNRRRFEARKRAVRFLHEELGLLDHEITLLHHQQDEREEAATNTANDDDVVVVDPSVALRDWFIPSYILQFEDKRMEKGATVKFCCLHDANLKLTHTLLDNYITFAQCWHHTEEFATSFEAENSQEQQQQQQQQQYFPATPQKHDKALIAVREQWNNILSECLIYMRSMRTTHSELLWQLKGLRR